MSAVAARPAAAVSHWFAGLEAPARPSLPGTIEADVCIVGAGMTGLWTAYEICRARPDLRVVVLERERVGFGASGRNGGWVMGELGGGAELWERRAGRAAAEAQARAIAATVEEIGRVVADEGIDCDFETGGGLEIARSPVQMRRLARRAGGGAGSARLLDAREVRERIDVAGAVGGLFDPDIARVQPAKLVAGLAAAAERAGATIYERTPVEAVEAGFAHTAGDEVAARWIVRATEAYSAEFGDQSRLVVPINSAVIVTEPLGDERWERLGWHSPELLADSSHMYVYLQRTADGRIAIGGRGAPYRYGSRTERAGPAPARTVAHLRARLTALFPSLADVRIDDSWHGVLGVSRDWAPAVDADPVTGLAWAGGYGGEGLAASNLAGRTLRDLVLGRRSELTTLPWVGPPARRWEPEPWRYLGIHSVYALLRGADLEERWTRRASRLAGLAERLSG